MAAEGMYEAQSPGGVSSTPDLRDPLGQPQIVTGPEYMKALASLGYNVENMSSPLPTMTKIAGSLTSLIDTQYDNAMKWQKSQADTKEAVARANNYDSVTNFNNQSLDYRLKGLDLENKQRQQSLDLFPLDVQAKKQVLKENEFKLQEAQRNADQIDKAYSEYQPWHDELAQLDPTDPDYDNKVSAINAKYPEASTNPRTQTLITPMLTEHNLKRSQSDIVQQRNDQLTQAQTYQKSGLLPPDTNVRSEVNAGRGQQLINSAKRQDTIHRLQAVTAYGSAGDKMWAQGQIDQITGTNIGPDPTMFSPNGDYNPGGSAILSQIEQRVGITPAAPGAKKEVTTTIDKDTGQPKTETKITGLPVTQTDINAQKPQTPATVPGAPTTAEDMQKDPTFQGIFSDLAKGKLTLPGNPKLGSPEQTAALYAEYAKRKAAAAQPPPGQTTPPSQRASKTGGGGLSEAQPATTPAQLEPHLDGALSGHAADFIAAGQKYGVDSRLLAAMSIFETNNGKSRIIRDLNNTAGITGVGHTGNRGDYRPFDSIADSIDEQARLIAHYQRDLGLKTIAQIGSRWAPAGGVSNDPNVTNWEWPREVGRIYSQLGGSNLASQPNSALARPKSVAEARALPPGTHFIDPEGNRRMVA